MANLIDKLRVGALGLCVAVVTGCNAGEPRIEYSFKYHGELGRVVKQVNDLSADHCWIEIGPDRLSSDLINNGRIITDDYKLITINSRLCSGMSITNYIFEESE